ncbi:MAG: glycosyltransferase [Cyclobacteriaceae bacterium]|nr:glycosyltransferase [Cyclobacteriaceae bacterium]
MLLYFYLIFLLYFIFMAMMIIGWSGISKDQKAIGMPGDLAVSVVIAVRNEEKNIVKLLRCLSSQTCQPKEIIIVDDWSEDDTVKIIHDYLVENPMPVKILKMENMGGASGSPKKAALTAGISMASGNIIVLTDGDCYMGKYWLQSMRQSFCDSIIKFVSGPVAVESSDGLLGKVQSLEFCSLLGSGAAMLQLGYPLMCNGANIAFRKAAFLEVNGYSGVDDTATGDDVYLMQKIYLKYPESLYFNKNEMALVKTHPAESLSAIINQRTRWASKWSMPMLRLGWVLPVFLFLFYISFLISLPALFFSSAILHAVLLLGFKLIPDYVFLKKVTKFCQEPMGIQVFLLSELIYPVYAIYIGLRVHVADWQWKGRTFK